ncbi:N-(5'-phosphoribosyl)anthranilate isomerase [Legionella jamestowniensis]|uniref:N-(5'-phosphoribosyl)anthranilate isomerase n=2 Tax=Legionella jamestowniensis TaxID=455 RepID=A0A0W0UV59_9GAMM|nr:N-(5'-phosphoribosyl)anthranilate isomerase [Legionella jamestowniensis]OCH98772.1 N-(5'-phosphoribosyl)anthranilate isomerase [Legionella jamestowniensis]
MCGMTREQDIAYAAALGVDAVGLIFYPKSPRSVSVEQAKKLIQAVPAFLDIVAVMVNPDTSFVKVIVEELPVHYLQFHGDESPKFCTQFKKPYIKAIQAHSSAFINEKCSEYAEAVAILLDTPSTSHGGTGKIFDWTIIPDTLRKPIILAGGLTAKNIEMITNKKSLYAVDVCSGVESSPGVKDHDKMKQFVNALWGNYE